MANGYGMGKSRFGIWVNDGAKRSGYLGATGGLVDWSAFAAAFDSIEAVHVEVIGRGWVDATGVRPGVVTAYAVELLD